MSHYRHNRLGLLAVAGGSIAGLCPLADGLAPLAGEEAWVLA